MAAPSASFLEAAATDLQVYSPVTDNSGNQPVDNPLEDIMYVTRWSPCAEVSESPIEDELILVSDGAPPCIAVINSSGMRLWRALHSGPYGTREGTSAHAFFRSLADLGLVRGEKVPASTEADASPKDADEPPPAIVHTGTVEMLVYGSTGGPQDKPGFGGNQSADSTTNPKWPFPEVD